MPLKLRPVPNGARFMSRRGMPTYYRINSDGEFEYFDNESWQRSMFNPRNYYNSRARMIESFAYHAMPL